MTDSATLPDGFAGLEPYVADWARATRQERYDMRLSKTMDELVELYDAVAPHAEDAIAHLAGRDLGSLSEPEVRLLRLLYSFVLVSYAVNIFDQPKIPDSGAAFFDCVVEPAV
jgi:hypothetical protein